MSIKHFNQLSTKRRHEFLDHPENFYATEKLDGSNFIFGRENGRVWAARKTAKEKLWASREWPTDMWAQNFRLAHQAIEQMMGLAALGYVSDITNGNDFTAHAELLSPVFANTLLYEGGYASIVVYDPEFSFAPIASNVCGTIKTSHDGRSIVTQPYGECYKLSCLHPPTLDVVELAQGCKALPEDQQYDYLIATLSNEISDFGKTRPEGFVFTHKTAGWCFKVVDADWFTRMNNENYAFRRRMFKTPWQKSNSVMDVYTRNIAQGVDKKVATSLALDGVNELHREYFNEGLSQGLPEHVHNRNVEALASLYQQLQEAV